MNQVFVAKVVYQQQYDQMSNRKIYLLLFEKTKLTRIFSLLIASIEVFSLNSLVKSLIRSHKPSFSI
jgi:hypothetical protein